MLTIDEQERAAYITGNPSAYALALAIDEEQRADALQSEIDELPSAKQREQDAADLVQLWEFFHDCFRSLGATYPCPDISSDYDKNVIFEAIRRGEGLTD